MEEEVERVEKREESLRREEEVEVEEPEALERTEQRFEEKRCFLTFMRSSNCEVSSRAQTSFGGGGGGGGPRLEEEGGGGGGRRSGMVNGTVVSLSCRLQTRVDDGRDV